MHLAVRAGLGALHANASHLAVFAENLGGCGIEVDVVLAGRPGLPSKSTSPSSSMSSAMSRITNSSSTIWRVSLSLPGLLDGVVVEFEVVFVNDELHAGQFLHFAQLLHRELRLRDAAANEQVEFLRLVVLDALVHVVGNVGFRTQIVGVAGMSSRATSIATLPPPITATRSASSGHSRTPVG